ncbi:DUF58 domain-containing protein [Natronospirillum operosum]|nr:DUF58 domain-containing protein [Natronospirillum operosum]
MLNGTEVSLEQLLQLQQPARRDHTRSFAHLVGLRESRLAGSGLQMRELRAYQPGDDLRHLHWRATARLGEPLTRVFEQENELTWLLVLALTPGMYFGSRSAYKSVRAIEAAAALGWSRHDAGDAVGSLILSPHGVEVLRPARTRQRWLAQLDAWARHSRLVYKPALGHQQFVEFQTELQRLAVPGRPLVIFGDLLPPHDWGGCLQTLARSPVTLVQLQDPLEADVPASGQYPVSGQDGTFLIQGSRRTRERYQAARDAWFANLSSQVDRLRCQWVRLSTLDDPAHWQWQEGRPQEPAASSTREL